MLAPLAKRQKVAEGSLPPVAFKVAGMKCDTRLLVFDQEFQVHSMILKLHSAFFRKFMDSPEKQNLPPSTSPYFYNWVTSVDGDDGESWHLVSCNNYEPQNVQGFRGNPVECQDLFEALLRAFYVMPYTVKSLKQLDDLTTLADYYCCLRILSNTVNNAILLGINEEQLAQTANVNSWYRQIVSEQQNNDLLRIAAKLRNPALFRDAIVLAVSSWGRHEQPEWIEEPRFATIAKNAYNRIALLVVIAQGLVKDACFSEAYLKGLIRKATECGVFHLPSYFRLITDDTNIDPPDIMEVLPALDDLLVCNLSFPCPYYRRPGWGAWKNKFLSARVEDSELPWDIEESDW